MNLPDITNAPVAVDTETTGLYPDDGARLTTVSVATEGFSAAFPFALQGAPNLSLQDYADLGTWLKKQRLIFQNAKFDMTMFYRGFDALSIDLEDRFYWDTKEATGLLWPVGPWKLNDKNHKKEYTTSLKPVAEWLWGPQETEAARRLKAFQETLPKKDRNRFDLVPWTIHEPYSKQDAILTYRLFKEQYGKVDFAKLDREHQLEKVLYRMENRGIGFDVEHGRELATELRLTLKKLGDQLPVRATRQQMVRYWFEENDAAPGWIARTPTGQAQINEYTLWKLANQQLPFAQTFKNYLAIKDALSRWYDEDAWIGKVGKDGRLRVDYRQNGTVTGRLSGARVNLQAIPRDDTLSALVPSVRKLFKPKAGCELWEIDLSQAELRIGTAIAKCKLMRSQFEQGIDVHGETAKLIFKVTENSPEFKKDRYLAKTFNFARLYAAGPDRLVEQVTHEGKIDFTRLEAVKIMAEARRLYPEFDKETEVAASKFKERGWVQTFSGRRIYLGLGDKRYYKGFNAIVQGSVAELAKDWMIWIEHNYPGILLLQIHDSVVLEIPIGSREIIKQIQDRIEEYASDIFKIPMVAAVKQWQ